MPMRILQVKKYHQEIANKKYRESDQKVRSMFYFTRIDKDGYPSQDRKNGYVVFDEHRAVWGKNKQKATELFHLMEKG